MGTSGLLVEERGGPLGPQTQSLTVLVQLLHLGPSVVIATSWGAWVPRECPARLATTGLWGAPPASPGLDPRAQGHWHSDPAVNRPASRGGRQEPAA